MEKYNIMGLAALLVLLLPIAHAASPLSPVNTSLNNTFLTLDNSGSVVHAPPFQVKGQGGTFTVGTMGNVTASGVIFANGSQVCTAANGLCASAGSTAGWTNTSTQTTTPLKVGLGASNVHGQLTIQTNNSAMIIGDVDNAIANVVTGVQFADYGYKHAGIRYAGGQIIIEDASASFTPSSWYWPQQQNLIVRNGSVGINTLAPTASLDVAGRAKATELCIGNDCRTAWPTVVSAGSWGNADMRTETKDDAGAGGPQGFPKSGFYETSVAQNYAANWPPGASGWWHLLDVRHSNTGNNFAMQFAGSFWDQDLYVRKVANNPATPWSKVVLQNPQGNTVIAGKLGTAGVAPNAYLHTAGGLGLGSAGSISAAEGNRRSIQLATDTSYGGTYNDHSGALMYTIMPGGWGTAELHVRISNNWGTYSAADALVVKENELRVNGRISNVGTPTQPNDAATKEYVDAAASGGVKYMGRTAATYTGNLGGPAGANAKCNAQFAGSHMCTPSDMARSGATNFGGPGWVACDLVSKVTGQIYNSCARYDNYGECVGEYQTTYLNSCHGPAGYFQTAQSATCTGFTEATTNYYGVASLGPVVGADGNLGSVECRSYNAYNIHCCK